MGDGTDVLAGHRGDPPAMADWIDAPGDDFSGGIVFVVIRSDSGDQGACGRTGTAIPAAGVGGDIVS